jgi:rubrerythrin
MRVRPQSTSRERSRSGASRRTRLMPRREATDAPQEAPPPAPLADHHPDEHRARMFGGPIDRAQYACSCGYVFEADVSTSVSCPHCGTPQAW